MIIALIAPMVLGVAGVSVDYVMYYQQREKLQDAVDIAALASVKEMSLAGNTLAKSSQTEDISKSYVYAAFYGQSAEVKDSAVLSVAATPDPESARMLIEVSYAWAPIFAQLFDKRVTPIKVSATAEMAGDSLTCVLGLMQPEALAQSSIHLENKARLQADGCSVYSNSDSKWGLRIDGKASVTAQSICTAGGVLAFGANSLSPKPITDCPKIDDPLKDRAPPVYGDCAVFRFDHQRQHRSEAWRLL